MERVALHVQYDVSSNQSTSVSDLIHHHSSPIYAFKLLLFFPQFTFVCLMSPSPLQPSWLSS
eukprot:m.157563 g.157563  ORF g.157563 m.157563 type:complete len:62 (-) comp16311_c0_seq1:3239-3424(-)